MSIGQWWEEWQLRVLVLTSLVVQFLLFIFATWRRNFTSHRSIRFLTWVAYVSSDAIAIYALGVLFNRQGKHYCAPAINRSVLELVWVPILLMHLGGQDCITAYNIEDNELWGSHIFTALSKIMGAIYVFYQSWPTKWLLWVSILVFIPGILKCLEKPWALKSASINSLVSSSDILPTARTPESSREDEINTLEEYVKRAKNEIIAAHRQPEGRQGDTDGEGQEQGDEEDPSQALRAPLQLTPGILLPSQRFADLASPYLDRVRTLKSFWALDKTEAYASLQTGIYDTFDLLYTKIKMTSNQFKYLVNKELRQDISLLKVFSIYIRMASYFLPLVAGCLLPFDNTNAYNGNDAKVTVVLLAGTVLLEYYSIFITNGPQMLEHLCGIKKADSKKAPIMVSQYSLVGFFGRNQRHSTKMCIVSSLGCKDLVDQLWHMKPCDSSAQIIELVIQHVKKGWMKIQNATGYRKFNNHRGQWTLKALDLQQLGSSLRRPFNESVLVWHIATDVCFYFYRPSSPHDCAPQHHGDASCGASLHHKTAVWCRQISQYMMYLLFINPEMLLAGTRQNLFNTANAQLEEILKEQNIISTDEREIVDKLNTSQQGRSQERGGNFFHDAMALVEELRSVSDEEKVWEVIQGVWVEMLCFSASRCRGYLHAKSLGTGGEFLTYVWLLLSHMGMETLPERLQGVEIEGNASAAPSFSGAVRTPRRTHSV